MFNDPGAIRDHSEKLTIAQFPQFMVPTIATRLEGQLQRFIDAHADVILKPLEGHGGASVFRVTDRDANRNVIIETLTGHGTRSIMAQRYIPEIRDGDKRVLLIAGQPVPYALAAHPEAGRVARQSRRRGHRRCPAADRARPGDRGGPRPGSRGRGLLLVGLDVIGTGSPRSTSPAPPASRKSPSRPASTSPGCS